MRVQFENIAPRFHAPCANFVNDERVTINNGDVSGHPFRGNQWTVGGSDHPYHVKDASGQIVAHFGSKGEARAVEEATAGRRIKDRLTMARSDRPYATRDADGNEIATFPTQEAAHADVAERYRHSVKLAEAAKDSQMVEHFGEQAKQHLYASLGRSEKAIDTTSQPKGFSAAGPIQYTEKKKPVAIKSTGKTHGQWHPHFMGGMHAAST